MAIDIAAMQNMIKWKFGLICDIKAYSMQQLGDLCTGMWFTPSPKIKLSIWL